MSKTSALDDALTAQLAAGDPAASAFVSANAGAGKTHVLTARVARLLLAGASPSRILCVTYTRAAAAEMADRLLQLLGDWALAPDERLAARLAELEGGAHPRTAADLAAARRLFARALETPGGLKIQTIHAFCESVLRRFPLEAGLSPGFALIDERAAAGLAAAAARMAIAEASADPRIAAALARLTATQAPNALFEILLAQVTSRRTLPQDAAARRAAARVAIGAPAGETPQSLRMRIVAACPRADIARARDALRTGGKNSVESADGALSRFLAAADDDTRYEALCAAALTNTGTPRVHVPDKALRARDPWLADFFQRLKDDLLRTQEQIRALENLADTEAFLEIYERARTHYQALKAECAALDFDDLVTHAGNLLAKEDALWVRYRLDQGVDHILLDEAQDTSPEQWGVIERLIEDALSGQSAHEGPRSFFAVGDPKQSIYSFQGADADAFEERRADLGKRLAAVGHFVDVPLDLSFRSAEPVLKFVDAVFAPDDARAGVDPGRPLRHQVKRTGVGGAVELWPLAPQPEAPPADAWDAPLNARLPDNPHRRLAEAIAADIDGRLKGAPNAARGRPFRPGDFLILVQSRSAIFHEMIRALTRAALPVAGADRIRMLEEPAVADCLAYARAALLETDDLSLAETLKSPFFGYDDDALYDLAHARAGTLKAALAARALRDDKTAAALEQFDAAARIGRQAGAFAFLSHILDSGEPSGRQRVFARLGRTAAEPLNELLRQALDYERSNATSLAGFLMWAARHAGEIKRELSEAGDAVRVMTVHGAKGLEADCVYLIDAHRLPNTRAIGPLLTARLGDGLRAPIFSANKGSDGAGAAAARSEAQRRSFEEYRRLFYVAATRARERLVIAGIERKGNGDPSACEISRKNWHALSVDAFEALCAAGARIGRREGPWSGAFQTFEMPHTEETKAEAAPTLGPAAALPAHFRRPAAAERRAAPLAPSGLLDEAAATTAGASYSPRRARDAAARGKALHRLIELLPRAPIAGRAETAERLLARLAAEFSPADRAEMAREALAVLADPNFAAVFGPESRSEAPVAGVIIGRDGPQPISGQIDRLAVFEREALIVDFKTNRPPPKRPEDIPEAYLLQLAAYRKLIAGIYPGRTVRAAILWTYDARLMEAPPEALDHAFARRFG